MIEQWQELKETITEMRDNDGKGTQQEVCKFLVNYMNVLEKQMQEPKTGHWEWVQYDSNPNIGNWHCSECRTIIPHMPEETDNTPIYKWCPMCGAKMIESQEGEGMI